MPTTPSCTTPLCTTPYVAPNAGDRLPLLIVGSGLAGLTVALELADQQPMMILAKRSLSDSATAWA